MSFNDFSNTENTLISIVSQKLISLTNNNSRRHLQFGYLNRLLMMQSTRKSIISIIEIQNSKPLQHLEATDLKIFLNSFYINICGALDNLAWVLNYELRLQNKITEDSQKGNSRRFTNLFGNAFMSALSKNNNSLAKNMERYKDWFNDLKKLRDPAAHRIPLSFVQSIVTDKDLEKISSISDSWENTTEAFIKNMKENNHEATNNNFAKSISILHDFRNVGKFKPIIITSEGSKWETISVVDQFDEDYKNVLDLSKTIIENL